jgi:hypothetical protein
VPKVQLNVPSRIETVPESFATAQIELAIAIEIAHRD